MLNQLFLAVATLVQLVAGLNTTITDQSFNQKVCIGTSDGFSSSSNDFPKWKAHFSKCVYVEGNVEINNFNPNEPIEQYDFSFLDDIKEITGYLLIHNTRLKSIRFKSLQLIRGKNLITDNKISLFIDNNAQLEHLDLSNLKEIQRGNVFIQNNPRLCHMNEVNWSDIMANDLNSIDIKVNNNADPSKCEQCSTTCCSNADEKCGCWFPNGCQKLSKSVCHNRCGGNRCYGNGPFDCCSSQCSGGCSGPANNDCIACSKLIIKDTGDCVETCPRIHTPDPITGDLIENPDGMYQYGNVCLKKCPNNLFIYREFCLKKCPNETYEEEELVYDPETGEKGYRRFCKVCTPHKCQKSCSVNAELNVSNIKNLQGCEVLNSNLIISRPQVDHAEQRRLPPELEANDLKALNSLRIVNGFVRIQSNNIQNLSFLNNLEVIRGNIELIQNKYSLVVISTSLKALGLNKLKAVENGIIHLQTDQLCLYDTINWNLVLNKKDSFFIKKNNSKDSCTSDGYVCDDACSGCWSAGPKSCQLCKTYKLDDSCVDQCENKFLNGKYIYLNDSESRECGYCHPECKNGCTGPSEYECKKCNNFKLPLNGSQPVKCVEKCPISHYSDISDPDNKICLPCFKDCYGCTGPKDYITQDGCTKCSSALVSNDPSYSILKCIEKDAYDCTNNEFFALVPQNLKTHPLKGKHVCRKCNDECDECYENGVKLNTQCKKCKNLYSNSTGECVKNCTSHNEYLDDSKMSCLSCNRECRLGCSGSSPFQCNQCRTYRIKLEDLERTLLEGINSKLKTRGQATSNDLNPEMLDRLALFDSNIINEDTVDLNDLKELYIDFYNKKKLSLLIEDNDESAVFCIPECPTQLPFKTADYFCTDDPKRIAQLIISNEWKVFMTFISITLIILFTILLILIAFWRYKLKMEQIDKKNEEKFFCATYDENGGFDESKKVDMSDLRLVKLNELKLEKMLGRGAFGIVYKGYYMPFDQSNYKVRVAIKVLNKYKQSDEKGVAKLSDELINEAKVMASVDHEYCLRLTALCLVEPMMLVTQLMNYGSVVSFFQKYRDRVTEIMLLTWSKQIAEGMTYLESRGIVHRDLAARNILVKKFDHIKITDFGLARVLDSNEEGIYVYEYSLVPFKWLAIESIKNRLFNHKSDVWSYGICLWEIFTFCSKPYAEYPETEPLTIYNCILKGTRLAKPQMASLDVYTILLRCWLENPLARPDFKTLSNEFAKMCLEPKRYLSIKDVDFNNPFKTIDDNTQDLLKEFKQDVYEERLTNNGSMSDISTDKNNDKLNEEDIDSELGSMTDNLSANNNTKHSKRFINSIFTSLNPNKHFNLNEKHSNKCNVITFKRSNQLQKNQMNDKESDESKMNKNRNFIKKFLHSGLKLPTRLDSQMSTGTASTYLSYSCSSDSPSPKIDKNKQKLNFNFYEEQEGLLNVEKNLYDYSLSPSRSNSNNSSRSTNTSIDQIRPIYKVQRLNSRNSEITNKTNSDYLEPIMTNVIQNLEYFSENNHQKQMIPQQPAPQPPPRIIITEDTPKLPIRNYYNDSMSVVLDNNNKRQTLI